MFGAVAVGMDSGHVYLVDLRLDDDVEEFDEWNPSHLEIVDVDSPNMASLRSRAREDGAHIAFELGGTDCFMYYMIEKYIMEMVRFIFFYSGMPHVGKFFLCISRG